MNGSRISGGGVFALTMLLIVGVFNFIQGLTALVTPHHFMVLGTDMLLWGFGAWGTLMIIMGVLLVLAGLALYSGQAWARTAAVVLAAVNVVGQLCFFFAFPLWSAAAIALNILAIYACTRGWGEAATYRAGRADAARVAPPRRGVEEPAAPQRPEPRPEHRQP
ncbi:DUF7144 family membrane protein [Marinitenerispora sediminis]|uniref:DUF7144 domain-containing protein n=1 Tax=Marinitenerispora sediminis TaxID=1931232 RepID=A0A368T738_9ACTN|nr:hypothetical protein [Marinitenerispora sediminis]RCV54097.1 hypothetical protein DEF23_16430 [Marinitenerispora sediminis]RCV56820.1 hypothetical protein DEF28_02740 [Marinitenerispora sediminis]RCV56943.1 hypothetical protein DEF24_15890 [Marinitenerispora sediminis]